MNLASRWNVKTVFYYLVCFVTLMMLLVGTAQLIRNSVQVFYPQTSRPGPLDIKMRYADREDLDPALIEEQIKFEAENMRRSNQYYTAQRLVDNFSLIAVALPVYLYHWKRIREEEKKNSDPT